MNYNIKTQKELLYTYAYKCLNVYYIIPSVLNGDHKTNITRIILPNINIIEIIIIMLIFAKILILSWNFFFTFQYFTLQYQYSNMH